MPKPWPMALPYGARLLSQSLRDMGALVMLRQSITLMFALAGFGLMSGCGGAAMSGDSGASKDKKKKEDAVAIDAADPYVVTGAYLTCDFVEGGRDVGCSLLDSTGERIKPIQVDSLEYSASVAGGPSIQATQRETPKWGAIWSGLSKLPKTKFKAYGNSGGNPFEFSCTGLPCTSLPAGTFSLTGLTGVVIGYNSKFFIRDKISTDPDLFCEGDGTPISNNKLANMSDNYNPGKSILDSESWKSIGDRFGSVFKPTSRAADTKTKKITNPFCIRWRDSKPLHQGGNCNVSMYEPGPGQQPWVLVFPKDNYDESLVQLQKVNKCQ